jgi:4-oxalmesaconate hydratase
MMIIDCHGHYTTAPAQLQDLRDAQLARLDEPSLPIPTIAAISDAELRASVEDNQLRVLEERGGDAMIFSPKASGMQHHVADRDTAVTWARASNDLVARVADLYPDTFVGVAQLPQTPDGELDHVIAELRRSVQDLGFVGCNVNPDPSGGHWTGAPLTDESWFPLYEAMIELDVPAMIHVSTSCNPNFHTLGAHYLNADTSVFMQFVEGDLFARFPELRFVIPHGGGAVPYHWGRFQGLATRLGRPPIEEHVMGNVFFDTAVYHRPGIELLTQVVGIDNLLFASEMLGAVRGTNPETGSGWDDTLRYLDDVELSDGERRKILEGNARRVYPRLADRLPAATAKIG